jgi:hypothetical protein
MKLETIKEPLVRIEKMFPFYRMHVTLMMEKLYQFPNETFTIDDFLDKFDTPAWNEGNTK